MDLTQLQKLITQAVAEGLKIEWWVYFLFFLMALLGSFFGAYLKKKGENYASKEDFNDLLEQVKKTSEATEKIKNEFYLTKATYDKYIETVMSYYSNIHRYYRSCQKAAISTHIQSPNGSIVSTKEFWEQELDEIVRDYNIQEGYIRLLLPLKIQDENSKLIDAFNEFRGIIKNEESGYEKQEKLKRLFNDKIDPCKKELESAMREFLKIEKLIESEP